MQETFLTSAVERIFNEQKAPLPRIPSDLKRPFDAQPGFASRLWGAGASHPAPTVEFQGKVPEVVAAAIMRYLTGVKPEPEPEPAPAEEAAAAE
jgi:hypothetical protein